MSFLKSAYQFNLSEDQVYVNPSSNIFDVIISVLLVDFRVSTPKTVI